MTKTTKKPEDFGIKNYEWVNGKLNVKGDVDLSNKGLKELPFEFGIVGGIFWCSDNQLTSLQGAPEKVRGDFSCSGNKLTSLQGAPGEIGWDFDCSDNQLTSLQGVPKKVGESFWCNDNPLSSFELLKTLFVDSDLPEKYHEIASKIEPEWKNLLMLEVEGFQEDSEEQDLLKALEKVSK